MAQEKKGRRSIRLQEYDYAQPGAYFVTICSHRRRLIFGRVAGGCVIHSALGGVVIDCLVAIPERAARVRLDAWVLMPNHLHFILIFSRGTIYRAPTREGFQKLVSGSLATVIRTFKAAVTRRWRRQSGDKRYRVWQRNYYERVIRNERELNAVRRYIRRNLRRWERDRHHVQG